MDGIAITREAVARVLSELRAVDGIAAAAVTLFERFPGIAINQHEVLLPNGQRVEVIRPVYSVQAR
jgi:hypothetical protein